MWRFAGLILLAACSDDLSIVLEWPNDAAHAAGAELQVYNGATGDCFAVLGKLAHDEPLTEEALAAPLPLPFDRRSVAISGFTPPMHVVVRDRSSPPIPIFEGCTEEPNPVEAPIALVAVIPPENGLTLFSGDGQVGAPGAKLPAMLQVKADASLAGVRHPLPGLAVVFQGPVGVSLGDRAPGEAAEAFTGADGVAEISIHLGEAVGRFEIVAEANGLWFDLTGSEREEAKLRAKVVAHASGISPVTFAAPHPLLLGPFGQPVALGSGDVAGDETRDLVILGCTGSPSGCRLGRDASGEPGRSNLVVVEALAGVARRRPIAEAGILPGGLAVASFGGDDKRDIAIVGSRRESCGNCEGGELRTFLGSGGEPNLAGVEALTASNAVGLVALADGTLVTAGQGRVNNPRGCGRSVPQCTSYTLEACATTPSVCGCPPLESCECPLDMSCETVGVCMVDNRVLRLDPTRRIRDETCRDLAVSCDLHNSRATSSSCVCGETGQPCRDLDLCGCKVPEVKDRLGESGTMVPFQLAVAGDADPLLAIATDHGPALLEPGKGPALARGPLTGAIQGVVAADFDRDGVRDVAWFSRGPCLRTADDRACPIVDPGLIAVRGCLGIELVEGSTFRAGSCRRYALVDRPAGVCAGDFNLDGAADLAVGSGEGEKLLLLPGDGAGGVEYPGQTIDLGGPGGLVECADFDADGHTDLAVVSSDGETVYWIASGG